MARRRTFVVDAESVQGNEGAEVTFRALKVGEWRAYVADDDMRDTDLLQKHVVKWNLVDDDDHEMPAPSDQPDILDEFYLHEVRRLVQLLAQGPGGENAKN